MEIEYEKFNELLLALKQSDKEYGIDVITEAFEFAKLHHEGQLRNSGEPYICHPIEVAKIIVELGFDLESVLASLLHDIVEDTEVTLDELISIFGQEVATLVDGVTKLGKIAYISKEEQQMEYLRKMFFAMAKDIRVILIKLADRLHNMRTLDACSRDKQLRIAHETIEIFAPLSHRLGMRKVKIELEDTSLKYLDPVGYGMIEKQLENAIIDKNLFLDHICTQITERLNEYIRKGFTMDDERLKNLGGGNYWKELLDRIRDIRSSEKVLYRQVLDLYATSVDYDPKSDESITFFKIVQNKLHFAAHGHTAAEVIYERADCDKPFRGLTSFSGNMPTAKDVKIAKNYLEADELKVLNNLVSGYFDFAEIQAMRRNPMYMSDYINQLDSILSSTGEKLLNDAGKISHEQAMQKAMTEYRKYQEKTLTKVEHAYLETIKMLGDKTNVNK